MSHDRDYLEEERRGLVRWLLDVAFDRRDDDDNQADGVIHRIGTINRLLQDDD